MMSHGLKDQVELSLAERNELQSLVDQGREAKSTRKRARILLKVDQGPDGPGWTDERAAEFAEVGLSTVHRVRQRSVEEGFQATLFRKSVPDRLHRKLDSEAEARLIATACSEAPEAQGCNGIAWS